MAATQRFAIIQSSVNKDRDPPTPSMLLPDVSLVIPAYNEEVLLPRLLRSVAAARFHFEQVGGTVEVIVADNDSTDRTAEVAVSHGCRVARCTKRVIAAARNAGAKVATAPVLAFVDADTQLHPETFVRIAETMNSGAYVGGACGWQLERQSLGLRTTEWVTRVLLRFLKVDGGVVFCERAAFEAIGGYDENRDVGEDVQFLIALRRYGAANFGKGFQLDADAPATLSTRKWDEHGDWHMFQMAYWPLIQRRSFHAIVREYWYRERPSRGGE